MQDTKSDDVTLSLEEGRVECDVSKDEKRLFSVLAGPVAVRVVGTRFSVERSSLTQQETVGWTFRRGSSKCAVQTG
jgi:ferric-dicitrate binding protein FerR (iron transport regulator)